MEDAERIPIDLGYEVAAEAEQPSDPRMIMREDGTVTIDILAPQPCQPEPTTDDQIVVCAEAPDSEPQPLAPPRSAGPMEKIGEALNVKIGPLELGSIDRGDGARAFGARIRF